MTGSNEPAHTARRWSLKRRLYVWIVGGVLGMLAIGTMLVFGLLELSLRRELEALAAEEVAELEVLVLSRPVDEQIFREIVRSLDATHPEVRISIRVWRMGADATWLVAGERIDYPWPHSAIARDQETVRLDRLRYVRAATIDVRMRDPDGSVVPERVRVEVLIDGAPRAADLEKATVYFASIATLAALAALGGGLVFSHRLAQMLERVAASASEARLDVALDAQTPTSAPDEIRHVVEAFRSSVEHMREQHRRNILLTAGLAHELRSPLQNMISEAEVALMRPRDVEEYRRLTVNLLDEMRALALVVDNLVTLTSLRDRGFLARSGTFDFAEEIGMRLGHEEREAARRGVSIDVRNSGDCTLRGDREALVLMLRNLVGNAVRWTTPESEVVVTLDGRDADVVVTVADSGPGVPVAEREAIFEAFYQGQSPDGARAGYGLGLALARAAARCQGGDIAVEDGRGGGAQFRVRLPRSA